MADAPWAEIREKFRLRWPYHGWNCIKTGEEPYKSKYSARALLEGQGAVGPAPEDEDERPQAR